MKKKAVYFWMILSLFACEEEVKTNSDSLNVSGIKSGEKIEVVNISLKSGEVSSTNIDCYVFSSSFFDPKTAGFGYVDCNSNFNLINPINGEIIKQFPLPGLVAQTVVDTTANVLIGQYNKDGSSYVLKLDLEDGEILSTSKVDFSEGILACTYFFDPVEKSYVLLKADSTLIYLNPDDGSVTKSVKVESIIDNAVFDAPNNRLIGITYSPATDQNYIEVIGLKNGALKSKVEIKKKNSYYGCMSGYDSELNCYILVTPQNEILFIDIESGEIKNSYQLAFDINEFKFWRGI